MLNNINIYMAPQLLFWVIYWLVFAAFVWGGFAYWWEKLFPSRGNDE